MSYRPIHPHGVGTKGFATYRFKVIRGANTSVVQMPEPNNPPDTPYPPITEPNPLLFVTRDVKELLGICDIAGFAEHLEVWAKATSGWRRLWEYDAEKVSGFALAPKSKTPGPPSP